jgi:hypothetical protein
MFREGAAGWSRVKNGCTREQRCYNFWSRREQEVGEKLERGASTHQTMEMSYLWRRSSWLEQSEEWRHQGAGMYNFWSRMGQEVREKCRGEPIHTRQWR